MGKNILVVENSKIFRESLESTLRIFGHEVKTTSSLEGARNLIEDSLTLKHYDFCLSGGIFPKYDSEEPVAYNFLNLRRHILDKSPQTTFILLAEDIETMKLGKSKGEENSYLQSDFDYRMLE